jgi:hypothetical protein
MEIIMATSPKDREPIAAPSDWQGWQRWVEDVDWSDWRSWLRRVASTDWAAELPADTPWQAAPKTDAVRLTAYTGRRVLGMVDCLWGLLDGSTTPGSPSR